MGVPQELLERARKCLPLRYLRDQFPDIKERGKDPFIEAWHDKNPSELLDAVNYYESTRERSAFFFKIDLPKDTDGAKIAAAIANKTISDEEKDYHHEIKQVVHNSAKGKVYAKVHMHGKEVHVPNAEHHKTFKPLKNVRYRVGKATHVVMHITEKVLEAKTHSATKAIGAAQAIGKLTCKSAKPCEQVIFDPKTQAKIDDVRYQQATARNLNIAGTTEIVLKGSDVEKTIDHFKKQGIDLTGEVELQKSVCENKPFKFFPNGKVKANGTVKDIFEELKSHIK
jgi:hypothetical protein